MNAWIDGSIEELLFSMLTFFYADVFQHVCLKLCEDVIQFVVDSKRTWKGKRCFRHVWSRYSNLVCSFIVRVTDFLKGKTNTLPSSSLIWRHFVNNWSAERVYGTRRSKLLENTFYSIIREWTWT